MDTLLVIGVLAAGIRLGMSIGFAAIGESLAERSGVFNIGLEGVMLVGAFAGAWGAVYSGSAWVGLAAAMVAGMAMSAIHAAMVLLLRIDQFVSGIAIVILGFGISGFAFRLTIGASTDSIPRMAQVDLGWLSNIPVIGPVLFAQSPLAYVALVLAIGVGWIINRTAFGLEVRACGADEEVARALAVPVKTRQAVCLVFGGLTAGLGGAYLSLIQVNAFVEGMVAGRGFLAVACVMLGRRRPLAALLCALGFGVAEAAQIRLQILYPNLPYQFLIMLPYVAAIVALIVAHRKRGSTFAMPF